MKKQKQKNIQNISDLSYSTKHTHTHTYLWMDGYEGSVMVTGVDQTLVNCFIPFTLMPLPKSWIHLPGSQIELICLRQPFCSWKKVEFFVIISSENFWLVPPQSSPLITSPMCGLSSTSVLNWTCGPSNVEIDRRVYYLYFWNEVYF